MGQGWRRVTELMRQASVSRLPAFVPGLDPGFRPTSNARNLEMFREATEFSTHLRILEKDLLALHNSVKGQLGNLRGILLSPLPRVYEEGQHGPVPSEEDARIIGQNVNVDRITESGREMRRRLEQEVILPVKQWMVAYRTIQDRMKQLEALRLELDSRRRSAGELQGRFERQRSVQTATGSQRFKTDMELEQLAHRVQHKDEKLQRTSSQYREMESTVYNSLFTLVKDTSVLRDYAAAALLIAEECFHAAHECFHEEGGAANEYGSTNQAATTTRYSAMADVTTAPFYGAEDSPYTAPEFRRPAAELVQPQASRPAGGAGIFRTISEKVGFHQRQQDIPEAAVDAAGAERGGTSGGGGHDSEGEHFDQGYGRGMSEQDIAMIMPRSGGYAVPAYDGGSTQFRAATFGTGAPPATNNRYAAGALPVAAGGWHGNY